MEGYVYVISNRAMPGLMKVGFTTNTPEERASQLDGTHSPHPMEIEYRAYVPNVHEVEMEAHRVLRPYHEGKEWFRCSRDQAVGAVKRAAGATLKREQNRAVKEAQLEIERQAAQAVAVAKQQAEAEDKRKEALRVIVENKYYPLLEQVGRTPSFFSFWLGASVVTTIVLIVWSHLSNAGILLGGALLALIPAAVIKEWADERRRNSEQYTLLLEQRQKELNAIDKAFSPAPQAEKIIVKCPFCTQQLRIPSGRHLKVTCIKCRTVFDVNHQI